MSPRSERAARRALFVHTPKNSPRLRPVLSPSQSAVSALVRAVNIALKTQKDGHENLIWAKEQARALRWDDDADKLDGAATRKLKATLLNFSRKECALQDCTAAFEDWLLHVDSNELTQYATSGDVTSITESEASKE